ncbi:MAG TPA: cyclic nucleotide-binding domain-containing protein, partial [Nitrospinota bacterium]|nr:cyclic nucleotide-binding domain-containing protein [Nitrospinota bacterium]
SGPLSGLDAIYALFGWIEGKFEFYEEEIQIGRVIKKNRMEILLDAMRMLDDGLIKKVGPLPFDEVASVESSETRSEKKGTPQVIKGPLIDYSHVLDEEEYHAGERIARAGGHGKWIWIILKGSVNVSRETSNGPMNIANLGEGCFIGGFTILPFMEYTRSVNITALDDVRLGLLDTEFLYRDFMSLSPDFRRILLSLDGRLRKITDRAGELFMKDDKTKGFTKNKKIVIEKGSSKQEAFAILEGETYVIGQTQKGYLPLLTLEKDEVFGYMPFTDMGHEPRSALVLASKDLKVHRLDTESLQKEYEHLSGTFRNMIYNACTCTFLTTKLAYHLYELK